MTPQSQGLGQYAVVPAEQCHLRGTAECHIGCFPDQFMAHMGADFTAGFFLAFLNDPQGLAFVALDQATGKVVGLVVGGRPGIRREFLASRLRRHPWALLAKMVVDRVVRAKLLQEAARRLGLRGKNHVPEAFDPAYWDPKEHWAKLVVIAVLPEFRGTGVADALLAAMVDSCARAGYSSVYLSVYKTNPRGVAFYRRNGWEMVKDLGLTMTMGRALGSGPNADRQDAGHVDP